MRSRLILSSSRDKWHELVFFVEYRKMNDVQFDVSNDYTTETNLFHDPIFLEIIKENTAILTTISVSFFDTWVTKLVSRQIHADSVVGQ